MVTLAETRSFKMGSRIGRKFFLHPLRPGELLQGEPLQGEPLQGELLRGELLRGEGLQLPGSACLWGQQSAESAGTRSAKPRSFRKDQPGR